VVDYAVWQREHLSGGALEAQLGWWKQALTGSPPLLEMPWEKPRPEMATSGGIAVPLRVDPAIAAGLRQLAAAERTTLFNVVLAAIQAFLSRYSGQEDIVVGTPYAGRAQQEVQQLAGCLINTVVLRTNVSGQPSFQRLLQRTAQTTMAAFDHADAPFTKVVDTLRVDRSAAFNPVYQVRSETHVISALMHVGRHHTRRITHRCSPSGTQVLLTLEATSDFAPAMECGGVEWRRLSADAGDDVSVQTDLDFRLSDAGCG
jgi:Condensation domain